MPIARAIIFIPIIVFRHRKHQERIGVYIFSSMRVTGFLFSGLSLPFIKKEISTGVSVMARKASTIKINVFVQASGENSFPSMPVSKSTGRKDAINNDR